MWKMPCFACGFLVAIFACCAQTRADLALETETARLLPPGRWELSAAYEFQTASDGKEYATPLSIAVGLMDRMELLVEPVPYTKIAPSDESGASGVGDPALSIASKVGPSGHVIATDVGPDMMSFAAELAAQQNLRNIEFREAAADSLPFADASFDIVTCRFGAMFFPDLQRALRECRRVLKPGGKVVFIVWGVREQPFTSTTVGVLLKYVQPPEPDPDAPSMFMFGVRGRFEAALKEADFQNVKEQPLSVPARWALSVEEYWTQFTEVAAPFRPLLAQLSPARRDDVRFDVIAGLQQYVEGGHITFPLEIVLASATRP